MKRNQYYQCSAKINAFLTFKCDFKRDLTFIQKFRVLLFLLDCHVLKLANIYDKIAGIQLSNVCFRMSLQYDGLERTGEKFLLGLSDLFALFFLNIELRNLPQISDTLGTYYCSQRPSEIETKQYPSTSQS